MTEFANLIEPVARELLGEPNKRLSHGDELRFGTNGSVRVSIAGEHRGTWRDHEAATGGGVLDLIVCHQGGDHASAARWIKSAFPGALPSAPPTRREVAAYPYANADGEIVFEVIRFEPKDFRQRRPNPSEPGKWIWNLKGVEPILYRLPDVLAAIAEGRRIYIVEGEKDADRLAGLGLTATCNPGGAGKWKPALSRLLDGASVAILPDNDDVGIEHGEQVARALHDTAADVRVLALGEQARKGDVSDWLDAGGTAVALDAIAERASTWRPSFKPRFPLVWFGQEDAVPPLSWLVRGLMVEGGVSVVYGAPKSSKTFLVLDLALHVAHGREWYGLRVKGGGVVYVCGEGAAGVRQRMKVWRLEKHGDTRAPFALLPQSINLFDAEDELDRLIADVNGLADPMGGPVRLVVFDTVSRMIGPGDEDKARDINVIVRSAERVQRETGAHVMFVHHSGKDRDRGMRGSNAFLGAVDVAIEVTKADTGLCEAKVPAIKDGGDVGPFTYTLRQSAAGLDEDGEAMVSCVIEPAGASQGGERTTGVRLSDPERWGLAILRTLLGDMGTRRGQTLFVPKGTWSDNLYSAGDGEHDAKKKRAWRVVKGLQDKGIVSIIDDMASIVEARR